MGLQQTGLPLPPVDPVAKTSGHGQAARHEHHYPIHSYGQSEMLEPGEEYLDDIVLSDDDSEETDKPAFQGLFKPALFKSLLRKAKIATNMDLGCNQVSSSSNTAESVNNLFPMPTSDSDYVPWPDLFAQVVKKPWERPGSMSAPNNFDRKLYCASPDLDLLLQLPSVDEPVASLTSSSVLVGDAGEGLKQEDKRAELTMKKLTKRLPGLSGQLRLHPFLIVLHLYG